MGRGTISCLVFGLSSGDTVAVRGWFPRGQDHPQADTGRQFMEDPLELQSEGQQQPTGLCSNQRT